MSIPWSVMQPEDVHYIVIHCSATPRHRDVDIEEIDRWHRDRGWLMVGYHHVIKLDGTVQDGRPHDRPGAHVGVDGLNHHSIGICYVGGTNQFDIHTPEDTRTDAQRKALRRLVLDLQPKFPNARIVGHRDLDGRKDCPSFSVSEWLDEEVYL